MSFGRFRAAPRPCDPRVTGTPAPEWEPEPALAERIVDFTHRNWEEYARVFGAGSEGVDLDDYAGASYGLRQLHAPRQPETLQFRGRSAQSGVPTAATSGAHSAASAGVTGNTLCHE
jgi:hypothetical protein